MDGDGGRTFVDIEDIVSESVQVVVWLNTCHDSASRPKGIQADVTALWEAKTS